MKDRLKNTDGDAVATIGSRAFLKNRQLLTARVCDPRAEIPLHRHDYIEMIYMYHGLAVHFVGNTEITLREGDLLLMNQYVTHRVTPSSPDTVAINFIIRPEFFDIPLQMIKDKNEISRFLIDSLRQHRPQPQYLLFHAKGRNDIGNLLENLIETVVRGTGNENIISQYTTGLVFLHLLGYTDSIIRNFSKGLNDIMVQETLRFIDTHYSSVTLSQIAGEFHQPLSSMSKIIKDVTGLTFRQILMQKRFQKAVQLLLETDLPVEAIAVHVGYENLSYFYRQFKKLCGMTPRQYRVTQRRKALQENSQH